MADELDPLPDEGAEEQLGTPVDDDAQPSPVEELAGKIGWSPKDQWKGDPDKWRPADEFIIAGRDIQQTTSRELRAVREQMERLSGVTETIVRDKVAERDAYWENRLTQAVDDGDHAAAKEATRELAKSEAGRQAPPDPTVSQWVAKNDWFNTDPLAALRAREISDRLGKAGVPVPEQLTQIDRAMRKEFPELFPAPAKTAPGTQTGSGRPASPTNRIKGYAHMPDDAQKMAMDYKERHGVPTEEFAKRYWANRGGAAK